MNEPVSDLEVLVDGVRISYQRTGFGAPLLLVHGLVGSVGNWEQNIEAWSQVRTVYAIDQVNMGKSERVAGVDAGLEASADRVLRFMHSIGLDVADIAGHSHGGAIVMMLAERHPERVRSMVLFAPANPFSESRRGLIRFYDSWLGNRFARLIPRMPRLIHDLAHRRMYCDQSKVTRRALDGYSEGLNPESVEHLLLIVRSWWNDMAKLRLGMPMLRTTRTLIVWGDRDTVVDLKSGGRLAEEIGAELVVVPGTGHLPFQEKAAICNELVSRWLEASLS
jgi:pimeloyl-ACP methyl ester carboxylesterase